MEEDVKARSRRWKMKWEMKEKGDERKVENKRTEKICQGKEKVVT